MKTEIPIIGKKYHFFDDGKIHFGRHYTAIVLRVVPFNEAHDIIVKEFDWNRLDAGYSKEDCLVDQCIIDTWKHERDEHPWLYANETDYFVELSVPAYDEWNLWAVRTKDGGWFTFDIQSTWQSGRLDIDGALYQALRYNIEWMKNEYGGEYPIKDDNVE